MNRKAWLLLLALTAANIILLQMQTPTPAVEAPQAASAVAAEPSGAGHWHSIADIPLEDAKRLGPWSMTASYEHGKGIASAIHRLGDRRYYRIYTIDGSVYYQQWWGEAWVVAEGVLQ